jgi:hypothetical protein
MAERGAAEQLAQYRRTKQDPSYISRRDKYLPIIQDLATKYNIDPNIAHAIVYKESRFNPNAYNPNDPGGARGLGQFIGSTARAYGLDNTTAFDPYKNLDAQARLLRDNLARAKGDQLKAIRMYNGAPGYAESVLAIAGDINNGEGAVKPLDITHLDPAQLYGLLGAMPATAPTTAHTNTAQAIPTFTQLSTIQPVAQANNQLPTMPDYNEYNLPQNMLSGIDFNTVFNNR